MKLRTVLYAVLFPALCCGCARKGEPEKRLAEMGNRPVVEADFERYAARAYPEKERAAVLINGRARNRALDDFFTDIVLEAKAEKVGLYSDIRFTKAAELMEQKLLSRAMTETNRTEIEKSRTVLDAAVRAYYEANRHLYMEEPSFTAYQLVVYVKGNPAFPDRGLSDRKARARAGKALAALRSGMDWETAVSRYSDEASSRKKDGLIRSGRFEHFAKEVANAVRTQPLGKPGPVFKSVFGYHVVQVEERVSEPRPKPFEKVEKRIKTRLIADSASKAATAFIAPLRKEMGLKITESALSDASLFGDSTADDNVVLAVLNGEPIRHADFKWFLKDALVPNQRIAYTHPGAAQAMLQSYLDMRVLSAEARRLGLDKRPDFIRQRDAMKRHLLIEFLQARDTAGPLHQCSETPTDPQDAEAAYIAALRAEMGLKIR